MNNTPQKPKAHEAITGPKEEIRQLLVSETKKLYVNQPIQILTMPGEKHLCVDRFKQNFPNSRITCIEKNKDICNSLQEIGLHPIRKTMSEYLESVSTNEGPFQLIYLDYFSYMNSSVTNDLHILANGNGLSNGILPEKGQKAIVGITLSQSQRSGLDKASELISSVKTRAQENIEINKDYILARIKAEFHVNFYCQDIRHPNEEYRSGDRTMDMYFFCLLLERK